MDLQFGTPFADDYQPDFGDDQPSSYGMSEPAPSPAPTRQTRPPEPPPPARTPPSTQPRPQLQFGTAFGDAYQPDIGEPEQGVIPAQPGTASPPAQPPDKAGDKPFGSDWSFMRGLVTSGVGGNLQGLGGTIDAFNLLSDGDANSTAGKAANFLDALGKKGSAGYELQAPSVVDVIKSPSKAGTYLGEQTGSLIGSMGPTAAGWALGTAGGTALGEVVDPAGGGVPGGIVGGYVGSYIPSFIQNTGDTLQGMREDPGIQKLLANGTLTQKNLAAYAVPTGAIVAGLDSYGIGEVMKLSGVSKEIAEPAIKKLVISTIAKAAASHGAAESATEGAQQLIQETATVLAGGDLDLAKRAVSILDASVSGFLGGGLFGGGHETYHALKPGQSNPSPTGDQTGVIATDNAGSSSPGGTSAGTPPPPAGADVQRAATEQMPTEATADEVRSDYQKWDGPNAPRYRDAAGNEYNRIEPVLPASPAAAAAAKSTQPQTIGPVAPDAAAALTPTTASEPTPAPGPPAVSITLHPIEGPQVSPTSVGADVSAAVDAHNAANNAIDDVRRGGPPSPVTSPREVTPPVNQTSPREVTPPPQVPPQIPAPSASGMSPTPDANAQTVAPAGRVAFPQSATLPASSESDVISEPVPPRSANQQTFDSLLPDDGSFVFGQPFEDGYEPDIGPAPTDERTGIANEIPVQNASASDENTPAAPAITPGEGLSKTQRAAFDDITADIQSRYDDPNDSRIQRDLEAAHEFIRQQPVKQPSSSVFNRAVKHLNAMRAGPAAVERATAVAPAEREARREGLAAEAAQPRTKTPEQLQEVADRADRSRIAEDALSSEQAAEEGAADTMTNAALDEEAANESELRDPILERALATDAQTQAGQGGQGGGTQPPPPPRGPRRPYPGSPGFKATRILSRSAKSGIRQALKAGVSHITKHMRQWIPDHWLATNNEQNFHWTDAIDPDRRIDENPLRQIVETRAREGAKRERLARPFKKIVDRLVRLRAENREAYEDLTQLMADSTALQVDPTKPLSAPENGHLGQSFTKDNYQGRQAHKHLEQRYNELVQREPKVAQLWADIQEAFRKQRAKDDKARVTAFVRQVLDRANERDRKAGKANPTQTGKAASEALADRVINGQLTAADKKLLSPSVQAALEVMLEAGRVKGTYLPLIRRGQYAVHWKERMQLPKGATWAKNPDGSISDDTFVADNSTLHQFVNQTLDDTSPNAGLVIREINAFKDGPTGKPVYRNEVSQGEWDALSGPVKFEVQVQLQGMSLHHSNSEAQAARDEREQNADEVRLEERDETRNGELLPTDIDQILKRAKADLEDTGADPAVVELLDRTLRDAVTTTAAGNGAAARRLQRRNVSGAENNLATIVDRYGDMSSGVIAKMEALPELDAGMRGLRDSDKQQSATDPHGQLERQAVVKEMARRIANPEDHFVPKGAAENAMQGSLTAAFLTKMGDVSSVIADMFQPYLFGIPRITGRVGAFRAAREVARAEKAINSFKVAGHSIADTARAIGEAASGAKAQAVGWKNRFKKSKSPAPEGVRYSRADIFEAIRDAVGKETDGRDLQRMMDELADSGLMSRDANLDIKGVDPREVRGGYRILESLADIIRQLRIGNDIRSHAVTAVAAYRSARSLGDTHEQAVKWARDVTRQSQFDNTHSTSAPMFKKRGMIRVPLMFKRFAVNSMIGMEKMIRSIVNPKSMPPEQVKEWRRVLTAANILGLAAFGVSGHPAAMIAGALIQAAAMAIGHQPVEWEGEMEAWLSKMFGEELGLGATAGHKIAGTIMRGIPSGLGPADISKRIGVGDLLLNGRPKTFDKAGFMNWGAEQIFGAPGDTTVSMADAYKALTKGDPSKALELVTPKFISNIIRAARSGPTDTTGRSLLDDGYTPSERIVKGLGFQPTRETDMRRGRSIFYYEAGLQKEQQDANAHLRDAAKTRNELRPVIRQVHQELGKNAPKWASDLGDAAVDRMWRAVQKKRQDGGRTETGALPVSKQTRGIAGKAKYLAPDIRVPALKEGR
ncbi:PLxRFG domain-containing protein [Rhizobium sp. RAF56]|uniref:PLxRFG domain-containing protein n=1 Tax=Rhizobium sp. RAF56 TaxID=3233062 RepID=UPI003F952DCB